MSLLFDSPLLAYSMFFDAEIDESILKDFRQMLDPILIESRLQGQTIREGRLVLGTKAGPSYLLSNLFHEVSHFIEIDRERMLKNNWGLKYGLRIELDNQVFYEPQTAQHIEREARVWAIQFNLQKSINQSISITELACSSIYLNAFYLYKGGNDKERIKNLEEHIEELSNLPQYSCAAIMAEFAGRKLILANKYKSPAFKTG